MTEEEFRLKVWERMTPQLDRWRRDALRVVADESVDNESAFRHVHNGKYVLVASATKWVATGEDVTVSASEHRWFEDVATEWAGEVRRWRESFARVLADESLSARDVWDRERELSQFHRALIAWSIERHPPVIPDDHPIFRAGT